MPGVTLTIASTTGLLLAYDVPLPLELPALAMVGLVLRWLVKREAVADTATLQRITDLEAQLEEMRDEQSQERHLKHGALNRAIAAEQTLRLVKIAAGRCSCGALDQILSLLAEVSS